MGDGVGRPVGCEEEGVDGCDERVALGCDPEFEKVEKRKAEREEGRAPDWVVAV